MTLDLLESNQQFESNQTRGVGTKCVGTKCVGIQLRPFIKEYTYLENYIGFLRIKPIYSLTVIRLEVLGQNVLVLNMLVLNSGACFIALSPIVWSEYGYHYGKVKWPGQLFSTNTFSTNTFCPNTSSLITIKLFVRF